MSFGEIVPTLLDGESELWYRVRYATAVEQGQTETSVRLWIVTLPQFYRLAELPNRVVKLALAIKSEAQIVKCIRIFVAVRDCLAVKIQRRIQFAFPCERIAEVTISVNIFVAGQLDCLLIGANCFVDLSARIVSVPEI